jgi:DNA-binding MarR family transcriptional regulator
MKKLELIETSRASPQNAESPALEAFLVADRLHSAAIHLLRRVRKKDDAAKQGPARLSALSVLVFAGQKTLGELAAAEQVKPPTMSRIVAGLERSRLVTTAADAHDARRMRIRATAKGTRLLHQARQRRIAYLASRLESLPHDELAQLAAAAEILKKLLADWG